MLNLVPLLDIARRYPRIPRTPARNVPDSIASSNDVLPPTTMDTISASTTGFDLSMIMLICGLLLLMASCMLIATRVRKQRLA